MWGQEERSDVGGKKEASQVREKRIDLFFILSVGVARYICLIPKPA